jgi:protein required for attachment to host cells
LCRPTPAERGFFRKPIRRSRWKKSRTWSAAPRACAPRTSIPTKSGRTAAGSSSHNIGGNEAAGFAHNAKAGAPNKSYQPAQTPQEHEAEQFAKEISKYLMDAHQEGRFQQLVISASPQFLGALRMYLDSHIKPLIKLEVNKDYTHSNAQQLREQIREQLQAQRANKLQ